MPARRAAGVLLVVAWSLTGPVRVATHDLERSQVALTFAPDGAFTLDLANDPDWLLLRLEPFLGDYPAISRRASASSLPAPDRDARLAELAEVMRDRVVVFVDGVEIRPHSVVYEPPSAPTDASGQPLRGHYRMHGRVPPSARTLRWFYGIVSDAYPLVVTRADGQVHTEWIGGTVWSGPIDLRGQFTPPTVGATVRQYLGLGFTHILPKGLDHILFVLGLFLLSARLRPLLWQVTAFTAAHSITLGLSMYGVVSLPPAIVEPLIALSIAYVAVENVLARELRPWRVLVVFLFGLLHGLGFAGVLRELGLPPGDFLTALLAFNIGVEAGQLTVIALAALVLSPAIGRSWFRARVAVPLSAVIAAVGLYWCVTRLWMPPG